MHIQIQNVTPVRKMDILSAHSVVQSRLILQRCSTGPNLTELRLTLYTPHCCIAIKLCSFLQDFRFPYSLYQPLRKTSPNEIEIV